MNRFWKGAAVVVAVFTTIASAPPIKPSLPSKGTLEYGIGLILQEQEVTHVRNASALGRRCYRDLDGKNLDHEFKFDDSRDRVTVTIVDNDGVSPGKSFSYKFYFRRPDGTFKPNTAFTLTTSNPFSATEPAHRFEFILQVNSSSPATDIPVGTVLGGVYELSESVRDISADVQFFLKTDLEYSNACQDYD